MKLRIDRQGATPIYRQIAAQVREQISTGRLPEGRRLPTERDLARTLGLNRSTVLAAYAELKADGVVDAHVGRGTVVLPQRFDARPAGVPLPFSFRQITRRGAGAEPEPIIRDLLELGADQGVIPLSVGLPAPELLPLTAVRALQDRVLTEHGAQALLHTPTEGLGLLRESLAQLMAARGFACEPGEVLVTTGSQQGLDLLARVLLDPGDPVVVEQPSFFGALEIFRNAGARVLPVPVDDEGMRVDVLEELLGRHRPKFIYTLPTFQNPSGACLSLARRQRLLELAYRYQVPIVEDDLYSELRYEGEPLPTLRSLDRAGHVVYLSSVSKVLFPGLRLGWVVAPRPFLRTLALAKQAVDLHSGTLGQFLLDAFLREGYWAPHVEKVRKAYAARRKAMLQALLEVRPKGLQWRRPEGGFYVWCSFPARVPPARLLARAAHERVSYLPGEACLSGDPTGDHHLRLNFSYAPLKQIRPGIERLARALAAVGAEDLPRTTAGTQTRPIT